MPPYRLAKRSQAESRRERVQSSRATAQEQADIVNKFMEMRQEKLRSENCEEKEKLNAQMIQVNSLSTLYLSLSHSIPLSILYSI